MLICSNSFVNVLMLKNHGINLHNKNLTLWEHHCGIVDWILMPTIYKMDLMRSQYAISGSCVSKTILVMLSLHNFTQWIPIYPEWFKKILIVWVCKVLSSSSNIVLPCLFWHQKGNPSFKPHFGEGQWIAWTVYYCHACRS